MYSLSNKKSIGESEKHEETQDVSIEEYNHLAKRVESMEKSVGVVLSKVKKEILETLNLINHFRLII